MKKRTLLVAVVLAAMLALLLAPAVYAAPAAQDVPVSELTPIAAWLFLTTFLVPPIIAGMKRLWFGKWQEWARDTAVFVVCLLFGLGEVFFNGSLVLADGDPRQIANIVVINMALTVGAAFVWYKMFWKPSTIDDRIAGS